MHNLLLDTVINTASNTLTAFNDSAESLLHY